MTLCALVAICASAESTDTVKVLVAAAVGVPLRTRLFPEMDSESPAGNEPEANPVPPVKEYGAEPPEMARLDE